MLGQRAHLKPKGENNHTHSFIQQTEERHVSTPAAAARDDGLVLRSSFRARETEAVFLKAEILDERELITSASSPQISHPQLCFHISCHMHVYCYLFSFI